MNTRQIIISIAIAASVVPPVAAQEAFTGDTRYACEAILCLASGTRPDQCSPSLARYFSIRFSRWSDTLKGRVNFLKLCPSGNDDPNMGSLINAVANGAGFCDASALNSQQVAQPDGSYYISNAMPGACTTYANHPYTDLKNTLPVYVGTPERHGYWVAPSEYNQAVIDYNTRIQSEDAATANQFTGG